MRTIAAIATPLLNCAIHIIRVSGSDTFKIVQKITKKKIQYKPYSIQRNFIIDENRKIIDDVLLNVFVKPFSYTGEDAIEINCHGGVVIAKKILNLLIINGCEMAQNGEFSQQAFLNNKLNYQQIEGINNLIHANNELATSYAIESVLGNNSYKIQAIRDQVFEIIGSLEVNIDYPEYDDVPQYTHLQIASILMTINQQVKTIIDNSNLIKPVFHGLIITIIGKPNVGKSSLLNKLTKSEKAIVHNSVGTTRDIVESEIIFNNIPLKILDTAGIHHFCNDEVEKIGIEKSIASLKQADLVIWLVDANHQSDNDDKYIQELIHNQDINYVKVYNKSDLNYVKNEINISCINNDLDQLLTYLDEYTKKITSFKTDELVLQSDRQLILMRKIHYLINDVIMQLNHNIPLDLIIQPLEEVIKLFNDLLGISFNYDKLDELFQKFCLGK